MVSQSGEQLLCLSKVVLVTLHGGLIWQVEVRFVGVVQKGHQAVILTMSDRVVLVSVALAAAGGQPEPCCAGRRDPVSHCVEAKLQRINAAFFVEHRVSVKASRDPLIDRRVGQHVASHLLDRELVEGHVCIQCSDYPVSIWPHRSVAVFFVAVCVGVASEVKPASGPTFSVLRPAEKIPDKLLVSCVVEVSV